MASVSAHNLYVIREEMLPMSEASADDCSHRVSPWSTAQDDPRDGAVEGEVATGRNVELRKCRSGVEGRRHGEYAALAALRSSEPCGIASDGEEGLVHGSSSALSILSMSSDEIEEFLSGSDCESLRSLSGSFNELTEILFCPAIESISRRANSRRSEDMSLQRRHLIA